MTIQEEDNFEWCYDCKHFIPIFYNVIGLCENNKSDHFRHVIEKMHPACLHHRTKK